MTSPIRHWAVLVCLSSLAGCSNAHPSIAPDEPAASPPPSPSATAPVASTLARCFNQRRGCFVAFEETAGWVRNDAAACSTRRLPCSTFKIPNSIIGLEEGVLQGPETVLDWPRERYPAEEWWPEIWKGQNDLRSAFASSVVPYYRHLATLVGEAAMQRRLDQLRYGNRSIGDNLDAFWLEGPLAISADEQIDFLRRFTRRELGVSDRTTQIVEDIMVVERRDDAVLRAKTGMGTLADGSHIGWYVGYVEDGATRWFFATNVLGDASEAVKQPRVDISRTMLRALNAFGYDEPGCE